MVLGKAGSRQAAFWYETVGVFWRLLLGGPTGVFLKALEIESCTQITILIKDRHGDLLKTVPGSQFETT